MTNRLIAVCEPAVLSLAVPACTTMPTKNKAFQVPYIRRLMERGLYADFDVGPQYNDKSVLQDSESQSFANEDERSQGASVVRVIRSVRSL